ncbi:MAG: tRNA (cytidine(34)-2'-O)-methyltransferase [Rhabdochlamydiaceae bacterium]|nr:tRNA (cytidine(34)-2'-O)-methyltransferase [Candidatus Amphrikana amoebophyrae]
MKILLYQPQIPQNTGNIIRTCKVTGATLILIEPLGFDMSEKSLRRAQLDYAKDMDIQIFPTFKEALKTIDGPIYFLSSKGTKNLFDVKLDQNVTLVFGNEKSGLSEEIMSEFKDYLVRLPMKEDERCLNLSNAVAISTYEVLRQNNFNFKYEE